MKTILTSLNPIISDEVFIFSTFPYSRHENMQNKWKSCDFDYIFATIREEEGVTLILENEFAKKNNITGTFPSKRISLQVHSNLNAVGLISKISSVLAENGISVNPISGYYHDHLFVSLRDCERALKIIKNLILENR